MALDIAAVAAGMGTALESIDGLRVYSFQAAAISAPAAIVLLPKMQYDSTFARGSDEATFTIHLMVGKVDDRTASTALAGYMSGTGASSVKSALESDPTLGGAAQTIRVTDASVQIMPVGGIDYLTATFNVDTVA